MKRKASRPAVFYYTRREGTRMIAEAISAAVGAMPCRIGLEGEAGPEPAGSGRVFLGTPARLGVVPRAVLRFCRRADLAGREVALFCVGGPAARRAFRTLRAALPGARIRAQAVFRSPLRGDEVAELDRARAWARSMETIEGGCA